MDEAETTMAQLWEELGEWRSFDERARACESGMVAMALPCLPLEWRAREREVEGGSGVSWGEQRGAWRP